jgi:2,3-dihydroxybenzoate decarboxylase
MNARSSGSASHAVSSNVAYQRIATEEAYAPRELVDRYQAMLKNGPGDDLGFWGLWGYWGGATSSASQLVARITDLGEQRIRDMDASGIAKQVLSLTSPGVQVFDAPTATGLATEFNDQLAETIRRRPDRFAGLAAIAPQDPNNAARELERAVRKLGLKGAVINSHTRGEYLDDQKFWPIFEAAEALNAPIYLHPNTPPPAMVRPFYERRLEGSIYGFAVETGLHMLRIIISGAFDRFPKLQIVVGHLGEAIPFWLYRIDYMHRTKFSIMPTKLEKRPSDYVRQNFYITTSGMAWEPAIMFVHSLVGPDRLMYAMDYPYQYVPEEVSIQDNLPLSETDKRKFFQLNAQRVFSL